MAKPVVVPDPSVLHQFLAQIRNELSSKLTTLENFRTQLRQLWNEKTQDALEKQKEELLEIGRDENGEPINPDIQEALDWMNEGLPDLQEQVEAIGEQIDEATSYLEEKIYDLKELLKTTPKDGFVYKQEEGEVDEGEDGEEDREIGIEEELQKAVKGWRRDYGPETARIYEIRTRMRTGIGAKT